MKELLVIFQ